MDLKILNKSDKTLKFVLETDAGFANALRRTMTAEVPIMAIENVTIEENNSGMFDEAVAHRLGMIPLAFDAKLYNMKGECPCGGKGCSRCEVVLVLDKTGPCTAKSGDMKSTADDVKPVDADIPVVELLDGQKLKFEATAQLGCGKDHGKWKAAIVGYQNVAAVKAPAAEACEEHVFDKKDGKLMLGIEENCSKCMKILDSDGVKVDENSFLFSVETVSGLKAEEIVNAALVELEKKTEEFTKEFSKVTK